MWAKYTHNFNFFKPSAYKILGIHIYTYKYIAVNSYGVVRKPSVKRNTYHADYDYIMPVCMRCHKEKILHITYLSVVWNSKNWIELLLLTRALMLCNFATLKVFNVVLFFDEILNFTWIEVIVKVVVRLYCILMNF